MAIRLYRPGDAASVAQLSASCQRNDADYVLNPMWEDEAEFFAEFERHGIRPEEYLLVADDEGSGILGLSGFLREAEGTAGGLLCPIVARAERGRGIGGELLRGALALGKEKGMQLATAGIGTRNRSGYSLLTALGFRPVRQHFLMRCEARPKAAGKSHGADLAAAEADDVPAILALYLQCGFEPRSQEEMTQAFASSRRLHAVARLDGKVVAFVELETHWPRRNWVAYVGVAEALRDRGLGSALVGWALAGQFDAGAREALLILSPANRTAMRAYEKVGFRMHRVLDVLERAL